MVGGWWRGLIFDRDSSERNDLLRRNVHGGTNTHITHIYPQLRKSTQTLKKSRSHPVQLYRIAHNTYIHLFEHWVELEFVVYKRVSNTFFYGVVHYQADGEGGLCQKKHFHYSKGIKSNWLSMTMTSRLLKRYADNLVTFDIAPSHPLKVEKMWILSQD